MRGKHVYIRGLRNGDAPILECWNFDEALANFFPSRLPVSQREQESWFEDQLLSKNKKKLIVCDSETERPIGLLGILNIDHLNKNAEIGITIGDRDYWGKAHAREAMELVLEHLFHQEGFHLVYARVLETNGRALRFFEKLGFEASGVLRDMVYKNGSYVGWVWLSVRQSDWKMSKF